MAMWRWMERCPRRGAQGEIAGAGAGAVAVAVAVRSLVLAKAIEDPEGGAHGCAPFFIGTGMSRMKNPCGRTARAGL
ncbi:hypothetical protein GLA29479_3375 [Lysobacter antibioticus]|nr:hypothetical protein GLA29479_3375 [Lysobacter antibioticus]